MKNPLPFLRSFLLFALTLSASATQAKDCLGSISLTLKHADGTLTVLAAYTAEDFWGVHDVSVSLSPGDTVLIHQAQSGVDCMGSGPLFLTGAAFGDTANMTSPRIMTHSPSVNDLKIAQPGSFYMLQPNVDFGPTVRLFIDAPVVPCPIGLLIDPGQHYVAAGDTCPGPCLTAYLTEGQSVRMWPMRGQLAQVGGQVVVRHVPDNEVVSFATPPAIVPLEGYAGYSFSDDGQYLLTVEDPLWTTPAYAYVRVSHLPAPRVDMTLTIERSDGSIEEVTTIRPDMPNSTVQVDLEDGDSLRIGHRAITDPCSAVQLRAYVHGSWGPANWTDPLAVDVPSTPAGIGLAAPGSYYLTHTSDCGVPTAQTHVYINAPVPHLDAVLRIRHWSGWEEEVYRSDVVVDPSPYLEVSLQNGDSVRLSMAETGYCGSQKYFLIYKGTGPDTLDFPDAVLPCCAYGVPEIALSDSARYHIRVFGGSCFGMQELYLHIRRAPDPLIDLQVDHLQANGAPLPLTHALAGGPVPFAYLELAPDDSIQVRGLVSQAPCAGLVLKGYRSGTGMATPTDPVFLDRPLEPSGLTFRETGGLLLTVEDTCGAITASASLQVSAALSTGIAATAASGFAVAYANDLLLVDTRTGGRLEVRNTAGQLVRTADLAPEATRQALPLSGVAHGVYIATLRSASRVDVARFVVR